MITKYTTLWLLAVASFLLAIGAAVTPACRAQYVPPANNHVDLNFNYDWKFIKTNAANAQTVGFDDSTWSAVSLPHTWNDDKYREWCFTDEATKQDPLLPSGTYYGIGWYRKHFTINSAYAGRRVILEFQGIGRCAHFYVNGTDMGYHENGIGPCGLDVTSALNTVGTDNLIAVQVNNDFNYITHEYGTKLPFGEPFNLNFGGLNRDATLHISDQLHQTLPLYRNLGTVGTYIYPTNIDTLAQTAGLTVTAEVKNDNTASKTATLDAVIVDAAGNQVGSTFTASSQTIAAGATASFTATTTMSGIHFWSPDFPYLYQVYTILKVAGTPVDVYKTPLGVRKYKFGSTIGLELNGHPLYLNGYAPRSTMEWAALGMPVDWMVDYDFAMIKASNGNFLRPMHGAPRKVQVDAADKYGIIMTVPAVSTENDEPDAGNWQQKLADMRDVTIYFRNNPSVQFYEGNNGGLSVQHMQDMLNVRLAWDPNSGKWTGLRSNDSDTTNGIREFSCTMDGADHNLTTPLWDAEYARGEAPRRVWDNYTPMLNPRWDGVNASATPAAGTIGDTTHKYLLGGYFYVASHHHQALGLNSGNGDFIGDYLTVIPQSGTNPTHAYFRLQNSEDMVLQNLAKYWARREKNADIQPPATNAAQGVMIGGAKIIWADSVTDGRMHDMEVARVSGAIDGARLPKETFYGMQVAQNSQPQVYIVGHWNYTAGFVKPTVYVVSNTDQVKLQTLNTSGAVITDYGYGTNSFFPTSILPSAGDQVNNYVFKFDNVSWQPGSLRAYGYSSGSTTPVAQHVKKTAGAPAAIKVTPVTGPAGWIADGSDIAMFDVEVVDSTGLRCPTYEDTVTFGCTGPGVFLGGYNGGVRYSTNFAHLTSGYKLNIEAGINRVFARATRTAGTFALTVTGSGLTTGTASIASSAFTVTNGLTAALPQRNAVTLGAEPAPVPEGTAPPPPLNSPNPAPLTNAVDLHYSGGHQDDEELVENVQPGQLAYMDSTTIKLPANLPGYLIGGEFIRPFKGDANETSSTDQYQLNLSRYSYAFQLIDAANGMPNHDNNASYQWTKLTDTVTVNGRSMNVYKSRLMGPTESVYLAANAHENAAPGFTAGSNMYLLFIVSAEQELQRPTDTIASASGSQGTNTPDKAIDADPATRWNATSGTMPQVLTLTLSDFATIGGYEINWQSNDTRSYQYVVDVSVDGTTWVPSLDMSGNVNLGADEYRVPAVFLDNSTGVKYVRLTVQAASGGGWAAVNEFKVHGVFNKALAAVPVITSPLTISGQYGYALSYQITAAPAPTGFAAQNLPDGLTVNAATGLVSGTMSPQAQAATVPITITGINTGGAGSAVLVATLAAAPPVPVINNASLAYSTQAGVAIPTASAYAISATNMNFTPSKYAATLPSGLGLTYSSSTGKITGTPKYPGNYTIPIWGINPGGPGDAANLAFTVTPNGAAPSITSGAPPAGVVGTAYSYQIAATGSPTRFGATGLPPGLNVSTSTGLVSGTPTTVGTYSGVVFNADNVGGSGTLTATITVSANPNIPAVTSALTKSGSVGAALSYQITASPAATSYSATPLPPGVTLNATTGLISGTPTAQATTNVTLKATNSYGTSDPKTLVVTIGASVPAPVVTAPLNLAGVAGKAFSYQINATNSPTGYSASPLPAGVTLNSTTGLISGTPTAAATTTTVVNASNAGGTSSNKSITIMIGAAGSDVNLALNQPVTTSSTPLGTNTGDKAVDGSGSTRWESPHDDTETIYVDLGATRTVHSVGLIWEGAYGKNYTIDVATTAPGTESSWSNYATVTGNTSSGQKIYTVTANARYVRMKGTLRGSGYGYSLYELQVNGVAP